MCLKSGADSVSGPGNALSPLSKHCGGSVSETTGQWEVAPAMTLSEINKLDNESAQKQHALIGTWNLVNETATSGSGQKTLGSMSMDDHSKTNMTETGISETGTITFSNSGFVQNYHGIHHGNFWVDWRTQATTTTRLRYEFLEMVSHGTSDIQDDK
jgi:hypothetical protein